jgi:hypothetical protein
MQATGSSNQAARQSSAQSTTSSNQATRQSSASGNQATRQSSAQEAQGSRQSSQSANREDWQAQGTQKQEDRQDYGTQKQEDRQDYGKNAREDWQEYGEGYHGGYRGEYYSGSSAYPTGGVAAGMVIGATMTAAAFNAQKSSCSSLVVNGMTYQRCGSTWYQPSYQGGSVTYIVVSPPQ